VSRELDHDLLLIDDHRVESRRNGEHVVDGAFFEGT
jgi:hypothetical protein